MHKNPLAVAIIASVVGLLLGWIWQEYRENQKANLPLKRQGVREQSDETRFDFVNPSTRPRRILAAWYWVEHREPPSENEPVCCATIDMVDVEFTTKDYFPKQNCYYKQLGNDEIRAQEEGTIRVKIVDPSRVGWKYYGKLDIAYGDNEEPKGCSFSGYFVPVSDKERRESSSGGNPPKKQNVPHLTPDGRTPDGRRPLFRWLHKLPESL